MNEVNHPQKKAQAVEPHLPDDTDNLRAARASSKSDLSSLSPSRSPIGSVYGSEFGGEIPAHSSVSEKRPILGLIDSKDGPITSPQPHDTRISINMYPTQELGPAVDCSQELSPSLRPLMGSMEGDNFDLRELSKFISSPDPNVQCAALQLLERAAESDSTNFAECMSVTFDPVTKLLDSPDSEVRCAALDTLKLFLAPPHGTDVVKSMMPRRVVDALIDNLNSYEPHIQSASVELLGATVWSEEILVEFAAAVAPISSILPYMPTTTQVIALRVLEVSAGSNAHELVKAVAETFQSQNLGQPLSSPEATVQIAALKVLEEGAATKDPELARAVKNILPDLTKSLSSGETDVRSAARKVLEAAAHNNLLSDAVATVRPTFLSLPSDQPETQSPAFQNESKALRSVDQEGDMHNEQLAGTSALVDFTSERILLPSAAIQKLERFPHVTGGFGDVWKCCVSTSFGTRPVAVKSIRFTGANDKKIHKVTKMIRREANVWIQLSHDHILPFEGITMRDDFGPLPALVSQWTEHGSLNEYLTREFLQLSDGRKVELTQQVAAGLSYLHGKDIVHGDLAGANVLLDDAENVRLTDFGLSMLLAEANNDTFKSPRGNLRWVAPELVTSDLEDRPTKAGDIYSFGCVMLQIFSGKSPYHEWMDWHQVIVAIMAGQEPFSGVEIKDEGHRILSSRCLSKEPEERPSILAVTAILGL